VTIKYVSCLQSDKQVELQLFRLYHNEKDIERHEQDLEKKQHEQKKVEKRKEKAEEQLKEKKKECGKLSRELAKVEQDIRELVGGTCSWYFSNLINLPHCLYSGTLSLCIKHLSFYESMAIRNVNGCGVCSFEISAQRSLSVKELCYTVTSW
jgi:hypothetical protein